MVKSANRLNESSPPAVLLLSFSSLFNSGSMDNMATVVYAAKPKAVSGMPAMLAYGLLSTSLQPPSAFPDTEQMLLIAPSPPSVLTPVRNAVSAAPIVASAASVFLS